MRDEPPARRITWPWERSVWVCFAPKGAWMTEKLGEDPGLVSTLGSAQVWRCRVLFCVVVLYLSTREKLSTLGTAEPAASWCWAHCR